jgi:hypothetical protein
MPDPDSAFSAQIESVIALTGGIPIGPGDRVARRSLAALGGPELRCYAVTWRHGRGQVVPFQRSAKMVPVPP